MIHIAVFALVFIIMIYAITDLAHFKKYAKVFHVRIFLDNSLHNMRILGQIIRIQRKQRGET